MVYTIPKVIGDVAYRSYFPKNDGKGQYEKRERVLL